MRNKKGGETIECIFFRRIFFPSLDWNNCMAVLTRVGTAYRSWTVCPIRSTDRARIADSCRIGERTWINRSAGRSRRTPRTVPYAGKIKYIQLKNTSGTCKVFKFQINITVNRPTFFKNQRLRKTIKYKRFRINCIVVLIRTWSRNSLRFFFFLDLFALISRIKICS